MRAERAGELGALAHDPPRLGADVLVGVDEAAAPEARVEVQAAGDAVDVVVAERRLDVADVLVRELLRVVELVAVDQLAEALDGAVHLLGDRFGVVGVRRLVAARNEARDHRAEGPDAETRLHRATSVGSLASALAYRAAIARACPSASSRP